MAAACGHMLVIPHKIAQIIEVIIRNYLLFIRYKIRWINALDCYKNAKNKHCELMHVKLWKFVFVNRVVFLSILPNLLYRPIYKLYNL